MKPFIDECGIIHITYMANALFYQRKWLPLVQKRCGIQTTNDDRLAVHRHRSDSTRKRVNDDMGRRHQATMICQQHAQEIMTQR